MWLLLKEKVRERQAIKLREYAWQITRNKISSLSSIDILGQIIPFQGEVVLYIVGC